MIIVIVVDRRERTFVIVMDFMMMTLPSSHLDENAEKECFAIEEGGKRLLVVLVNLDDQIFFLY